MTVCLIVFKREGEEREGVREEREGGRERASFSTEVYKHSSQNLRHSINTGSKGITVLQGADKITAVNNNHFVSCSRLSLQISTTYCSVYKETTFS